MESLALIDLFDAQDKVAEEVNRGSCESPVGGGPGRPGRSRPPHGIITMNGTIEGLEQTSRFGDVLVTITRPQEAVYALQLLMRAFTEYYTTVADYNRAQFELFHALGYPARELAISDPPAKRVPVNTTRPPYLPPVGNGPPPATR